MMKMNSKDGNMFLLATRAARTTRGQEASRNATEDDVRADLRPASEGETPLESPAAAS